MKLIYEAANSIEAHLICNLLEQAYLTARVDGEYLQGGVGDLQAVGIVRVMVADDDYDAARELLNTGMPASQRKKINPQQQAQCRLFFTALWVLFWASLLRYLSWPKVKAGSLNVL